MLTAAPLVWAPSTSASANQAAKAQKHETTSVTPTQPPEAEVSVPSAAQAEREAKRAARKERKLAAEGEAAASSGEQSPAAAETPASSSPGAKRHGAPQAAQKRAERAAERSQKKAQKAAERAAGSGRPDASPNANGNAGSGSGGASAHGKARKEREREQRRRQREIRGEREVRHESRHEREAREASGGNGSSGEVAGGSSTGATTGATPVATTSATAPLAVTPPTGTTSVAAKGSSSPARRSTTRRGKHRGAAQARSTAALTGALVPASTIAATPKKAAGKSVARQGGNAKQRPKKPRSSPLVTTVTRIIGVIPTSLWIVMGGLALIALLLALSSRLAGRRAARLARQREELLEDVGLLQAALLPELPARLGPVGTTAAYQPASGPGAGGDFYDVFALENGLLAVLVGDVSGHGREALPHTTLVRFTLRAYLEAGLAPRETLRAAAPVLERQLGGSFATVVVAVFDPRERELTYACAGHPHPLLTGLEEDAAIIACSAPPIGAGRRTGTRETVVSVPGASTLCFYTDGVIEARVEDQLFGSRRLSELLGELAHGEGAAALLQRVSEVTDRRPDDMAAVMLDVRGSDEPPSIEREELELDARELRGSRPRRFLAAAGVADAEAEAVLEQARNVVSEHGSALLQVRPRVEGATATIIQNNLAPLRARAISRSQEVAL